MAGEQGPAEDTTPSTDTTSVTGYKLKKIYMWVNNQEKQVRPKTRNPGENTIAYYPLNSTTTVNDMSGNSNTLTNNGGVTFGVNAGVDCASFTRSTKLTATISNIPQGASARTTAFYLKMSSIFSWGPVFLHYGASSQPYGRAWYPCYPQYENVFGIGGYGVDLFSSTGGNTGQWYFFVGTYDGTNMKIFLNGVEIASSAKTLGTAGTLLSIGQDMIGYLSNVIIEDKARSAQEVADYYNLTKGNYGL